MLTRQEITTALRELGFASPAASEALTAGSVQVVVLDTPRIAITCPQGLVYMAVLSKRQLAQQLAGILGYPLPAPARAA